MKKVLVLLHDGFEEIEALTPVDLCRRAGMAVQLCSMTGNAAVHGSHGIAVQADILYEELPANPQETASRYDAILLPGGMPGSTSLRDDERVIALVRAGAAADTVLGAICAAPIVLERAELLRGRHATSFPGMLQDERACVYETAPVVCDGNIITSRGMGTAVPFGLAVVDKLLPGGKAQEISDSIQFTTRTAPAPAR